MRCTLLQATSEEEVQDGDDVALVGGDSAPQRLYLLWQLIPMAPRDVIQALQKPLAPIACESVDSTVSCIGTLQAILGITWRELVSIIATNVRTILLSSAHYCLLGVGLQAVRRDYQIRARLVLQYV